MRRVIPLLVWLGLVGCPADEPPPGDLPPEVDLTEPLGPDEARCGELTEDHAGAFIGGTAGESRPGDYLLYNDRARFVVRGPRAGHFYVGNPGSVIDADIVRPEGQADRDGLDDLMTMVGLPRLFVADSFEVVDHGLDGGPAVLRVSGTDASFGFLEGAIEAPGLFAPRGLDIVQTFTLHPGVPVLEITTTVTNPTGEELQLDVADAGMIDLAAWSGFVAGTGFGDEPPSGDRSMLAMVSHRNDLALATYPPSGTLEDSALTGLGDEFDIVLAVVDTLELAPGESGSSTRLVGVARDLATLERHRRALQGLATGTVEGTVTAAGPVAGARVFLTDLEGDPVMVAVTDDEGAFRIDAEPGPWQLVATGDGNNEQMDFPEAYGAYGCYAHDSSNELALRAFSDPDGATPTPLAQGYGRSEPVAVTVAEGETAQRDLTLTEPATLRLRVEDQDGDAIPAGVLISFSPGFTDPQPPDDRLGEHYPRGGARKAAWVLDGEMDVPIAPGTYDVVAHHGFRHEIDRADGVELAAGETEQITLTLAEAYETPGWVSADLHCHSSPSLDGACTIEERLATVAINDLQVHVATDHDHVADYRPAASGMGLDGVLQTVPGDEISPVIRGHHNIYPVEPDPDAANGGAPRWWEHQGTTSELHAMWRERVGPDGVLQANHGLDNGLFEYAEYDPVLGEPGDPDFYGTAFDTMEILNSGDYGDAEGLREIFCSLLDQGQYKVGVGVSDSHTRLPGAGMARTYVAVDGDSVETLDLDELTASLKAGHAVVSGGPFVTLLADDGVDTAGIGQTLTTDHATLSLQVLAPSRMGIDEVRVYSSGCQLVQVSPVDAGQWTPPVQHAEELEVFPEGDGYYFVEVVGSADLWPVWPGGRAYAMTNPIFFEAP